MQRFTTKLRVMAALVLGTFGCDVMPYGEPTGPGPQPSEVSGEELYQGLVLGDGPVAQMIPEVRDNWSLTLLMSDAGEREKVRAFQKRLVTSIKQNDGRFFSDFRREITSGDHLRVQGAMEKATRATFEAMSGMPEWAEAYETLTEKHPDAAEKLERVGAQPPVQYQVKGAPKGPEPPQICGPTVCAVAVALVVFTAVALHSYLAGWIAVYLAAAVEVKVGTVKFSESEGLINEMFVDSVATRLAVAAN